ncbi:MAG TPA: energy-coupling factor ABC transporter permease [Conexibacter sp.]|nr:energy-coupling factor ABC transporter permease [Conexibacter sp.]
MHIPDGFLSPAVALAADAGAVVALGAAALTVRREARASGGRGATPRRRPPLGASAAPAVGALVFAAQMLNVHVAGGTSGHLVGAVLACMLLGPSLGVLTIAAVLAVQALAFADGGLLTYGANVLAMGGLGAAAASLATRAAGRLRPLAAAVAGAGALLAGAVLVGALLELSGTAPHAIGVMVETHAPIALIEGAVSGLVAALAAAPLPTRARLAGCSLLLVALVACAPLASAQPDGLERVALDLGFAAQATAGAAAVALAPGYAAPGVTGAAAATVAAALIGIVIVALALAAATAVARRGLRHRPGKLALR